MRGDYVLQGFVIWILGTILYSSDTDIGDSIGAIFALCGFVGLIAGLFMKRKPSELEQLQIEKLKKELNETKKSKS